MNKVEPKTLSGFMELLPKEQILFNEMKDKIRESYEQYGFLPLDTPVIEYAEVLLAKAGGETEKQIYQFTKGDTDVALRFDLTVPLAKYVSKNYFDLQFPFRRYQIGKVYRGERAQKGRYREFYQCDIDIIGDGELNLINDAEIASVIYTTIKNIGFDKFVIRINNRKILTGFFNSLDLSDNVTDILRIIDKLEKIGMDNVKEELRKLNIEENKISKIEEFVMIDGTTDEKIEKLKNLNVNDEIFELAMFEIQEVIKYMRVFNIPETNFKLDLTIARGLDYYTGTVYETFLEGYESIGSVCSGGRYDNLAEYYTNRKLPGVGVSIGLTRLFYKLNEMNLVNAEKLSISEVLVIPMLEDISDAIVVANNLRNAGIPAEIYYDVNKKMKSKFAYADKLKIPYTIVLGEEEIKEQKVALKNMITREQNIVDIKEAIDIIKNK